MLRDDGDVRDSLANVLDIVHELLGHEQPETADLRFLDRTRGYGVFPLELVERHAVVPDLYDDGVGVASPS